MKIWLASCGIALFAHNAMAQETPAQFHLVGVHEYDAAELLQYAAHYALMDGGIDGQRLAALIGQIYQEDGYVLADVTLSSDGKTIVVDEGRVGSVRIEGVDKDVHDLVAKYVAPLLTDNAVSIDEIERALMLTDDIETVSATTEITYPDPNGGAELRIIGEQLSDSWGQITIDTPGRNPTSALAATIDQHFYHVVTAGDLLKLTFGTSYEFSTKNPSFSGAISYRAPVGGNGAYLEGYLGTLQARYNAMGILQQTDLNGNTAIVAAGVPVVRTVDRYGYLIGEIRRASSSATNNTANFKSTATVGSLIWLDGRRLDQGGALEYAASLSFGTQRGDTSASTTFNYARFGVGYGHPLTLGDQPARIEFQATGQSSSDALPATEKLVLGGRGANRAYDFNEISGDSGISLSVELALEGYNQVTNGIAFEPFGFVDFGWSRSNAFGATAASSAKSTSLGAGLRFTLPQDLYGQTYFAVPLVAGPRTAKGDPAIYVSISKQW
ncbi:ShlB/FhaC/HecB family hemolysin secretion/activation protein [Marivivens sp. LCG002]|uniref:ShlB/FhaC/HecB family hemolysin secretion/activation protein n=1 Tax=Marivivens sp. LCG002 TaxID=3051171 RepID=UPI0025576687|nr:ShlB/FhaC/HecB family hemolysin secretion/activation protein [Marivivens sp. LCG002]WIV50441.1 ShlB/FhaC/HecB family hemolysin secretion/activation protein [Marivivens sp. LCG002]